MLYDTAIEILKMEIKDMKNRAQYFRNSDYATGYVSAVSTIEGCIAMLESGKGCEDGET
jgi:hypothetical protein